LKTSKGNDQYPTKFEEEILTYAKIAPSKLAIGQTLKISRSLGKSYHENREEENNNYNDNNSDFKTA
jgi:hypothetical protein